MNTVERVADAIINEFGEHSGFRQILDDTDQSTYLALRAALARRAIAAMREPSEAMWSGLARDIIMWMDTGGRKTPRSLFEHLDLIGRDVPEWLKNEAEFGNLDHVPSKGTRAVIIFRAMVEAALAEGGGE